jgi:multiple sugar transport system substrate-binding protein/raffinose/stachyose/melibiose transport system substrate-binding protein
MKRKRAALFIVFFVCLFFLATPVFAGGERKEVAPEKKEAVDLVLMHDKGGNPNFQPYFEAVGRKTKELYGIGVTPTPYPTTDVFIAAVRSSLPTDKAPDLFTWWSTYRMKGLIDQGLVADLTDVWDNHSEEYSKGLRDAFTFKGKNYGFVYGVEYWPVWYNKDVFARLNLKEPQTWDEFIKICDTLKANKITPLFLSVQARWPTFIMFEEFIIGESPQLYVDLCEGKAKYTDPRVKKAFKLWADLIGRGYFTDPSTDLFADSYRLFNQDELAMVVCGTWYYTAVLTANGVPEEKIGAFILPSHNPKAGKVVILEAMPILASENAPHLEEAKVVVDWLMGSKGNAFLAEMITSFPANQKSRADYLPPVKVKLMNSIVNEKYQIMNRYWEATPTPICEAAVDKFAEFILNPGAVDKVLQDLDKIANDYWSKQ